VTLEQRFIRNGVVVPLSGEPRQLVGARVIGCVAVEPGERRAGEFQRQAKRIASECARLSLVRLLREREPRHQRALERPSLGYALGRIAAGEASGLVVADLSRLTHSVPELGRVLEWFASHHARLVAADPGFDTGEEGGRLTLQTLIEIAGWERQRLIERTRKGMHAARENGPASVADFPELRQRIEQMRAGGITLQAIADRLNAERIPTVRGGAKWRPSSVQSAAGYQRRAR
jgi:DNA invertase Pin-like site-specific DNA recombinase